MADTPQADRDVYRLLIEINGTSQATATLVASLHESLNGHVKRIDDHIERLYRRDKELEGRDKELEVKIAAAAKKANSIFDKFAGAWKLALVIVLALEIAHYGKELFK